MEWVDWAAIWDFAKGAIHVVVQVWAVFVVFVFLFWAVAMWRMIPRMDRLWTVEKMLAKRESKAKAEAKLPPRTYAENMADLDRAMERIAEGQVP